jgi:DNA-binding transcriptional LysR family regulator
MMLRAISSFQKIHPEARLILISVTALPHGHSRFSEYLKRAGVPRTPADLAQHACTALLTLERDVGEEWQFAKSSKREKIRFAPSLIADGEALREAALAGCGIIRVLACAIADELQSGELRQVLPDWECLGGAPIVAIYRKTRSTQARINAFLQHLAHEFRPYDNVNRGTKSPTP